MLMINEAARVLEDHVADSASDIDLAMLYGAGFAPFRGGLLSYADQIGAKFIVKRLGQLQYMCNGAQRFKPSYLLTRMAQADLKFYPHLPFKSGDTIAVPQQTEQHAQVVRSKM